MKAEYAAKLALDDIQSALGFPRLKSGIDFEVIGVSKPKFEHATRSRTWAASDFTHKRPKIIFYGEPTVRAATHELMHIYHQKLNPSIAKHDRAVAELGVQFAQAIKEKPQNMELCRATCNTWLQNRMFSKIGLESIAFGYEALDMLRRSSTILIPTYQVTLHPQIRTVASLFSMRTKVSNFESLLEDIDGSLHEETPIVIEQLPLTSNENRERLIDAAYSAGRACAYRMFVKEGVLPETTTQVTKSNGALHTKVQFLYKYHNSEKAKNIFLEYFHKPIVNSAFEQAALLSAEQKKFRTIAREIVEKKYRR